MNGVKGVTKINLSYIYVFVGEKCIFKGCYNHLDLSCGVMLCFEFFMAKV